jgi:hypothetical protein
MQHDPTHTKITSRTTQSARTNGATTRKSLMFKRLIPLAALGLIVTACGGAGPSVNPPPGGAPSIKSFTSSLSTINLDQLGCIQRHEREHSTGPRHGQPQR